MNFPLIRMYRLTPRGAGGLCCDEGGVALGAAELARAGADGKGRIHCEGRPSREVGRILTAAYGPQSEDAILRVHRGLIRAASAIEARELCLAGIETVLLSLPDPAPDALAKLAEAAELAKWGNGWENQPRVPAGQPGGGQWTDDDEPSADISFDPSTSGKDAELPIDDGVYRPATDAPQIVQTGGAEEDVGPRGSNGPPDDFTRLEDVFPGLGTPSGVGVLPAPIDGFLRVGALADEANLDATMSQYLALVAEIKQIDPTFADDQLFPADGIAGLSWQGRDNLTNDLLMRRAAAYYRVFGEVGPLQVETLRFLQRAVDDAFAEAVSAADAGRFQPRLWRAEAIGNWIDARVRAKLRQMFRDYNIPYGPRADVTVNNRDYQISENGQSYWIPDARLKDISFDWTLSPKDLSFPQIQGFFRTVSGVRAVIIVRPNQIGPDSTYLISRP